MARLLTKMTGRSHLAGHSRLTVVAIHPSSALGTLHAPWARSPERPRRSGRALRAMEACVGLFELGTDVESLHSVLPINAVLAVDPRRAGDALRTGRTGRTMIVGVTVCKELSGR